MELQHEREVPAEKQDRLQKLRDVMMWFAEKDPTFLGGDLHRKIRAYERAHPGDSMRHYEIVHFLYGITPPRQGMQFKEFDFPGDAALEPYIYTEAARLGYGTEQAMRTAA